MPVTAPSMDEFNALQARVTALEAGTQPGQEPTSVAITVDGPDTVQVTLTVNGEPVPIDPIPPDPIPPDPGPVDGVQAKRIADLISLFGVNTFSSLDGGNVWGSWPADYRPESVAAALKFCFPPECGFTPRVREYHYAGRESMQAPWLQQLRAVFPKLQTTLCVGANGDENDVPSMLKMQRDASLGIQWLEGLNEPNTDFGSGNVPIDTTMAIQRELHDGGATGLMGPSIVAGTPHPEGWIEGYCGDQLPALNAMMAYGNGHYYPPHCPDVPNTGYSINEYIGGLWGAYGQHEVRLTEFHPTLYAAGTLAMKRRIAFLAGRVRADIPLPGFKASHDRDAYYTLLTLLRCGINSIGLWWYALFDYGATYECGLFPTQYDEAPRETAVALQNLCLICADPSQDNRTFAPGKLGVTVEGMTANCAWSLYQTSDRRFLLMLWNAQEDVGGATVDVTVRFANAPASVTEFDPLASAHEISMDDGSAAYTCHLPGGVRILEIVP